MIVGGGGVITGLLTSPGQISPAWLNEILEAHGSGLYTLAYNDSLD